MRGANNRASQGCGGNGCAALVLSVLLTVCAPVPDRSEGLSSEECIALIDQVAASDVALTAVADTFALGTRATDVRRETLAMDLVGHRVERDSPVYEVSHSGDRYEVTSQPIPIQGPEAAVLIRAMAFVIPRSTAEEELLQAVKTDDMSRVRGIVQEIRLRTLALMVPVVLVLKAADSQVRGGTYLGEASTCSNQSSQAQWLHRP